MCNTLTFDSPNVLMTCDHGYGIPIYAFAGKVIASRLVYGHRIEFPMAHKYRYQMKELGSLLTSYAYSRALDNEHAMLTLEEMRDSLFTDIRNSLDQAFSLDDMMKFVLDNYIFINTNSRVVTFFGKPARVSDFHNRLDLDAHIKDCLQSVYGDTLRPDEYKYMAACLAQTIDTMLNR